MRHRPRLLAAALLVPLGACATSPSPVLPGDGLRAEAPRRSTAESRGTVLRVAARTGCGASVLDDPVLAQRLVAATRPDGPRPVEMPVFGCGGPFRAL